MFNRPFPGCLLRVKVCFHNELTVFSCKSNSFSYDRFFTRKWPIKKKHVPLNVKSRRFSYLFQNLSLVLDNHSYSTPLLHEVDHLFRVKRGLGYHLQSRAYHTADLPRRGSLGKLWHLVWIQQGSITAALVKEDLVLVVVKTFRSWQKK